MASGLIPTPHVAAFLVASSLLFVHFVKSFSFLLTLGMHVHSEGYCSCPMCMYICVCVCVSTLICYITHWNHKRDTNNFIAIQESFSIFPLFLKMLVVV